MSVPFRPFSKRIYYSYVKYHLRFLRISRHFRIKGTITLSCPQRKRGQNPKGTLSCPVHSLSVYTKGPIYCPPIRFPRINGATKGTIICPSYYVSLSERDNILSPLCTVYLRERDNIMSPSFLLRFPAYFTRGTIYCPFNTFPVIYLKGT